MAKGPRAKAIIVKRLLPFEEWEKVAEGRMRALLKEVHP
jgi:hypothetical protein